MSSILYGIRFIFLFILIFSLFEKEKKKNNPYISPRINKRELEEFKLATK